MTLDIMLPFYGRVDHFRTAVESVIAQTDSDWRLVVIDDAYPDLSAGQWLVGLGDPRIEYVRHPTNVGINANFQSAIDRSSAAHLVIFGGDDVMLPGFVQRVAELAAQHPAAGLIHVGTRVIDADGTVTRTLVDLMKAAYRPRFEGTIELSGEEFATSITRANWMNFPAIAWRRDLVQPMGFRRGWDIVQDLALALDVAFAGGGLVIDDQVVFEYRRHAESVSSWQAADGRRFEEERRFFSTIAAEFAQRGWSRAERTARSHLSSRLNAVTRIPAALAARDVASVRTLARHVIR